MLNNKSRVDTLYQKADMKVHRSISVSFRTDEKLWKKLKDCANKNDSDRSKVINTLIENYIEENSEK
ncbi:MAG: hypothetical protein LBU04_05815 [Christensenellaceae bacterium]|jgi:metal-responsive CopG/Arc/MetJ family transcriptional regulator|nr:hypothetical protein [Christensenellaceae bacterium]